MGTLDYLFISNKNPDDCAEYQLVESCDVVNSKLKNVYIYYERIDFSDIYDSIVARGTLESKHCGSLFKKKPLSALKILLRKESFHSFTELFLHKFGSVENIFKYLNKDTVDRDAFLQHRKFSEETLERQTSTMNENRNNDDLQKDLDQNTNQNNDGLSENLTENDIGQDADDLEKDSDQNTDENANDLVEKDTIQDADDLDDDSNQNTDENADDLVEKDTSQDDVLKEKNVDQNSNLVGKNTGQGANDLGKDLEQNTDENADDLEKDLDPCIDQSAENLSEDLMKKSTDQTHVDSDQNTKKEELIKSTFSDTENPNISNLSDNDIDLISTKLIGKMQELIIKNDLKRFTDTQEEFEETVKTIVELTCSNMSQKLAEIIQQTVSNVFNQDIAHEEVDQDVIIQSLNETLKNYFIDDHSNMYFEKLLDTVVGTKETCKNFSEKTNEGIEELNKLFTSELNVNADKLENLDNKVSQIIDQLSELDKYSETNTALGLKFEENLSVIKESLNDIFKTISQLQNQFSDAFFSDDEEDI